jgi:molybdate transport system ATP-binding protein
MTERGPETDATLEVDLRVERAARAPGRSFTLEVRFSAAPGITVLYGPSGAGKSTALAAIAGLLTPARGRVVLGGDVWYDSAKRVRRPVEERRIAFVFQSLALFPHLDARANVAYGLPRSLPRAERRRRAEEMLARMKVAHLADRRPATFSGGEAQRVALARALAPSPRLVLLDEPFSALDQELRRGFVADVAAFVAEARIPLIHVTHHRAEARALAQRVVLLADGRVTAEGSVDELLPHAPDRFDISSSR